ncbi:MAG: pilus assembly protein N-terminal domain-containing protein, partial [Bacteroidota bacterium]
MAKLGRVATLAVVTAALFQMVFLVAEAAQMAPTVTVTVNKSLVFALAEKARRVSVTQPEVAEVVVLSPNQLLINGKSVGTTSLVVWPDSGDVTNYDLMVIPDVAALRSQLRTHFPEEKIEVTTSAAAIVLKGEVSDEIVYDKILEIVLNYLPPKPAAQVAPGSQSVSVRTVAEARLPSSGVAFAGGGQLAFTEEVSPTDVGRWASKRDIPGVIDLLSIKTFHQIQLNVIVAEVNLLKARELGMNFAVSPIQLGNTDLSFESFLGSESAFSGAETAIFSLVRRNFEFSSVVRLFQNKDVTQILAQPNLVIKNGRSGGFLAGGEFPVIRSTTDVLEVE